MKKVLYLLLLTTSLTALADNSSGNTKAIQGKWKPMVAVLAGQPMDEDVMKIISLKMERGKYEVSVGKEPDRGTYAIDPTTQPESVTVTGVEGPNHGRIFPAIFELKGDTFRICYDLSGAKRPTEFKSVAGIKLHLVTYDRIKP